MSGCASCSFPVRPYGAGFRTPRSEARFLLGEERSAFVVLAPESNGLDYGVLYAAPHPLVCDALRGAADREQLRARLPAAPQAPYRCGTHRAPLPGAPPDHPEDESTMTLELTVSDEVRALAPGFTHVAVEATGLVNGPSTEASSALLDEAAGRLADRLGGRAPHEDPHLAAWRAAYTAFGAKPSRTRNSAEALAKRALAEGGLPRINALVDLYNAISVAHLIPVGGEDADRIQGGMRLVRATGEEEFATVAAGEAAVEHPEPGEVVWRDGAGVTCRRWNWRQGVRTRLTEDSVSALFLLEGLPPLDHSALEAAGDELAELLAKFSPGARITVRPAVS